MPEAMTMEECRDRQRECTDRVYAKFEALQASIQRTEVLVARIAGHLGINGSDHPRPHHRDSEQEEHLHRRTADVLAAAEALVASAPKPEDGIMLPRWAVYASAAVLILIVLLAAVAGEKAIPIILEGSSRIPGP